jgi:hypothetical protein
MTSSLSTLLNRHPAGFQGNDDLCAKERFAVADNLNKTLLSRQDFWRGVNVAK